MTGISSDSTRNVLRPTRETISCARYAGVSPESGIATTEKIRNMIGTMFESRKRLMENSLFISFSPALSS